MKIPKVKAGGFVKKQQKREGMAHLCFQDLQGEESIENSKRRHMFSIMSGDLKFFERLLTPKRPQDLTFISKTSARNR